MTSMDHKKMVEQICDFMGEDIDSPACQEVADHLKMCPTCKVYFDTVKKTVTLCRDMENDKKLPEDVTNRLYKVLNLDEIKNTKK
jgi:predicted anti-sigma-YlaC factor YlaD